MIFILVAVVAGVVIGLARGGSARNLSSVAFTLWPVLLAGLVVQFLVDVVPHGIAFATLLLSYGLLLAFCLANLRTVGMGVVAVGLVLNFVVIAANRGMPVRGSAIVSSGALKRSELSGIDFGEKRHLERPGERLTFLADIIPFPGAKEVLSFGDIIMSVGVADVVAHMLRRRVRHAQGTPSDPAVGP